MATKKMHDCEYRGCDGTRLGHELAKNFPNATQRFNDAMDRLNNRDEHYKLEFVYCEEFYVRRQGICDALLDVHGNCPYALEHGDHLAYG